MSAVIALLLVLSALTGCAGETLVNVKSAPPRPPAAVTLSVEVETYEDTVRDRDGAVLAECAYELPVMRAVLEDGAPLEEAASPEQERALAAAEAFNARFVQWRENPRNLAETAKEDRNLRNEQSLAFYPYDDHLNCTVYQTERLVSVSGIYSTWTGGAHPNTILVSWNFDLEAGEFFEPEILDEGGALQAYVQGELCVKAQQTVQEMGGVEPDGWYWTNYEDTLAEWSSYAVSFDEEGMTVGFSPYELANYAAGPQIFRLSYDDLSPHLGEHGRTLLGLENTEEGAD